MDERELRKKYITYFRNKGHAEIKSASLIPENDPSALFTSAGMHPLVPYLLGEKHPAGKRLVDCQKCIRTGDIEEIGDETHLTFFEMLGNWSLGDYFKEESIQMSLEFLTKELKIPIERLAVTVFAGDNVAKKDTKSFEIWKSVGISKEKIFYCSKEHNWWGPIGETGPCGPDTEIFYDTLKQKCSSECNPSCNCGKYVEIWNNVFMEYNKLEDGSYTELIQKNVDTGMGIERALMAINSSKTAYETLCFRELIGKTEELSSQKYCDDNSKMFRIIADHVKAITFILGDEKNIVPSNNEQGYVLRRLIRRVSRYLKQLGIKNMVIPTLSEIVIKNYGDRYQELYTNKAFILGQLEKEEKTFNKTIEQGLKVFDKIIKEIEETQILSGDLAFKLYDTFGFPIEFTQELCKEKGIEVELERFKERFKQHQELSRAGSEKKFKGGLADNSEETTKLHTATHLLNGALRKVLGNKIYQKGCNINSERLRFDFSFDRKLTLEEIAEVQKIVNDAINKNVDITCEEMTVEEAKNQGAIGVFDDKYGGMVKVYTIDGFSKEICGGPHIKNTSELIKFKILKEESSSAGVRRIKAVLQND